MLMKLQRYNLNVIFKQGKKVFMADTLSRAYPMPGTHVNPFTEEEDDVSRDYHNI